jgi:hypothetical protein
MNPSAKILETARGDARPTTKTSGEDFRMLKATVPAIEFGTIQWAAKRAGAGHTAQALDVFMRLALLERVREVVRGEIKREKAIPPDIAAVLADCHRGK